MTSGRRTILNGLNGLNWRYLVLTALVVAGCGGAGADAPPDNPNQPTLTRADVVGYPDGNAVGMIFSGVYDGVATLRTDCRCRQGTCPLTPANVTPPAGLEEALSVFQTDGHLRVTNGGLGGPSELLGGVDADGKFTFGGFLESVGETDYIRFEGTFIPAAGMADSFQATVDRTIMSSSQGGPFDCDLRFSSTWKIATP